MPIFIFWKWVFFCHRIGSLYIEGSVTNVVDESGKGVVSYQYTDFGITTILGDTDFYNEICYAEAIYDASTGLYYMGARYYDPEDGRFLSQDTYRGTATDYGTWNLYTYCANNPIKYVDPSGHSFKSIKKFFKKAAKVVKKKVLSTSKSYTTELAHITITNSKGVSETIDATPKHPFYVEGKGWVEASALHPGMTIWYMDGTKGTVEDISNEGLQEPVAVYNFIVEDFHTYFVSESGVLVHNGCGDEAEAAKKTYQTYIKTNPETGEVYVGRTSGTQSPLENVARRDARHHMNKKGFGPAVLDQSSTDYNAIRGREQMMIEYYRGLKKSGNAINGISPLNPNREIYMKAAKAAFGKIVSEVVE